MLACSVRIDSANMTKRLDKHELARRKRARDDARWSPEAVAARKARLALQRLRADLRQRESRRSNTPFVNMLRTCLGLAPLRSAKK